MQYRTFGKTGERVSALGFGMMRLPLTTGEQGTAISQGTVDEARTVDMLRKAIDNGINYVDTAYNYLNGQSERITGIALRDGYREKVLLASKGPVWMYQTADDFERILNEQLERLQTDCIDCYMLHGLAKYTWYYKVLPYGLWDKLQAAKAAGKIRYIGFSFHDDFDTFKMMTDAYDWDFCQIQLNYLDTEYQAGLAGLEYAAAKGMAVSIMEPLRGGYLANLPQPAEEIFRAANAEKTPVEWALDYLWDRPEVSIVLSGMGTEEQVQANMGYANRAFPGMLKEEEHKLYPRVKTQLETYKMVPCTGCAYCAQCPKAVVIPKIFAVYNEYCTHGDLERAKKAYINDVLLFGAQGNACVSCGQCEKICPQHIPISQWMHKIDRELR